LTYPLVRRVKAFWDPLTDIQRTVLQLLVVPTSAYGKKPAPGPLKIRRKIRPQPAQSRMEFVAMHQNDELKVDSR
jgi:hypothetical protein